MSDRNNYATWVGAAFFIGVVAVPLGMELLRPRSDFEQIQGVWIIDADFHGDGSAIEAISYEFQNKNVTMYIGGLIIAEYTFELNDSHDPKHIDLTLKHVEERTDYEAILNELLPDNVSRGIYHLNGNTLMIGESLYFEGRPESFDRQKSPNLNVKHLRREG